MSLDLDLSKYKLGWSDAEDYVFKPKRGLNDGHRPRDVVDEGRARLDARLPAQVARALRAAPDAQLGRRHVGDLLRRHLLLHQAHRPVRSTTWDELPDAIKNTYEKLGIPEAERKYLAGVTAQYESEVVFHRNREDLERQGVIFCDMDTALREYPEIVKQYFGTVIPPQRQQVLRAQHRGVVRRLVHLRAAGRRGRDAAAGLLPHQRREHGPVRAHADHRRRGLARCTTSRAARRRSTPPTRCTRRWSRSS